MTSTSLLVCAPELNLEKEICNTSYLLTLKFHYLRSGKRGNSRNGYMLPEEKPHYN